MTPHTDQATRLKALDPHRSFIVRAPAGSGKTSLLVQRFLALLAVHEGRPEQCVAITFTRKAAVEMRDRILMALERALDPIAPDTDYERQTWDLARSVLARDQHLGWQILQHPHQLKIQTIDALCASLVQQMPIAARLGSSGKISEDPKPLYQQAVMQLFEGLLSENNHHHDENHTKHLSSLLKHLDNNLSLAMDLLINLLAHREQWLPYVGYAAHHDAKLVLESGLEAILQTALKRVVAAIPKDRQTEIPLLACKAAMQLQDLEKDSLIRQCLNVAEASKGAWPGDSLGDHAAWQGFIALLLTDQYTLRKRLTVDQGFPAPGRTTDKDQKKQFQANKQAMMQSLEDLEKHPTFLAALQVLAECPSTLYEAQQWEVLEALLALLPILVAELSLVFQKESLVDFTEMTLAACRALEEGVDPTDLALSFEDRLQHLLVDEFQDTSFAQFRLLRALTATWQQGDNKTLFLVGDPMQSIYRFRQAEVGLFLQCQRQGFGSIPLASLDLTFNFRSEPIIIDWINKTFTEKFPRVEDMNTGAIPYHAAVAAISQVTVPATTETPHETCVVQGVDQASEPDQVLRIIQSLLVETQGSIALLLRSRSHAPLILEALTKAAIPYQGIDLVRLSERPVVRDLLALTKALMHLGDRIAWLSLLRTPWCPLSLDDLYILAHHASDKPLWTSLEQHQSLVGLSEAARTHLARVVPLLREALLNTQRAPKQDWVMDSWVALGGAQKLYDSSSLEDAEAFFEVLADMPEERFMIAGALEQRIQSLYAKASNLNARVQVMTIHKAKGLEFDAVIVPGVGRKTLSDRAKLLLYAERVGDRADGTGNLILAPIQSVGAKSDSIYAYLSTLERRKAKHEAMRLWYVAATRAKKHLYWFVHDESDWG
ncbi:MAG: UvrD-helicase domain-containing protein [Gammaproteobacteria bacterium]|nr:UvrD-helicase domain-containing protein [Gammaproteobacteria bacterium]MBP9729229.1 UvrD-helicase domain-containing protein [Gammaproteobacteria bacterium]